MNLRFDKRTKMFENWREAFPKNGISTVNKKSFSHFSGTLSFRWSNLFIVLLINNRDSHFYEKYCVIV